MSRPTTLSESIDYFRSKGILSIDLHRANVETVNKLACMLYDIEAELSRAYELLEKRANHVVELEEKLEEFLGLPIKIPPEFRRKEDESFEGFTR